MTKLIVEVKIDDWQTLVTAQALVTNCYQEIIRLCEADERLLPLLPSFRKIQEEHQKMSAILARYGQDS